MLLTPTKQLRYRCARQFVKCYSASGPFIYKLAEHEVINNKPHITLTKYVDPRMAQQPSMLSLFGMPMPKEVGGEAITNIR